MFGYVRPLKGELKVREFEQFKALYCSNCHALRENYGLASRFILNYDFTFLAMLFWEDNNEPDYKFRRCIASPCRKKCSCAVNSTLKLCAGLAVILAWWKLKDSVTDEGFFRSIPSRIGMLALWRAYKKASRKHADFEQNVRKNLTELNKIESEARPSVDEAADKFALILSSAADGVAGGTKLRALRELLYHTGRWIYILDALDDMKDDLRRGRYNPISARYGITEAKLPESGLDNLKITLTHSQNLISAAFELLDETPWTDIVRNIIYLGMPYVCSMVLEGTWKKPRDRIPR